MFSIVIPVYNAKASLERCVDSWLCQTRKDLEIILVDDGSSDGSKELCDELAKNHSGTCVRVIHQANSGVSAARNAGIRAAEGEFLLFTDSDDYVEPDYLEKMAVLQENSDADLVLCGYHHLYDGADIVKVPGETHVSAMAEFQQEFLELYKKSDLNMPWNKLYRKALAGVFDTSLSLGEDLLFNLEYLSKCRRVAVLGEPLCWYVQDVGKTTLSSEKRQNRMELAERICRETENFYEKTWGTPCKDGSIFLRYMNEVMDECEKLPDDRTLAYREKLEILHGYAKDPLVKNRGSEVRFTYPDYRILWIFLKRDMVRTVYGLCVVRSLLVKGLHEIRRSRR